MDQAEVVRRAIEAVSEICTRQSVEVDEGNQGDPYAERMREAWKQINVPDYPAGMIPWLDRECARLYMELTESLPAQMQRQWEARVPIEQFQQTINQWLEAHQAAVAMYRQRAQ